MTLLQEDVILKLDNSAQIFNSLSDIPGDVTDAEQLLEVWYNVWFSNYRYIFRHKDSGFFWGKGVCSGFISLSLSRSLLD